MQMSARQLLTAKAVTKDGEFPITELFFHPEDWTLRHAMVDLGGWFRSDRVLVSLQRFGTPSDGAWPLAMTRDELEAAPTLDDIDPGNAPDLPPLIVGPFGTTISPLMMASRLGLISGDAKDPEDLMRDGRGRVFHSRHLSDLIGCEAFTDAGPLGTIDDVTVGTDLAMVDAIFSDGTSLPLTRLRRFGDQGHAIFD